MNNTEAPYTTQLAAGLGMIPETLDLLRLWEPGMIPARLAEKVIQDGLFSRATARRARNLTAEMFAPRFLAQNGEAASRLKFLQSHRFSHEGMIQLCFLYTARAQRIFADFVVEVYWSKYSGGAAVVTRNDAENFVHRALDSGRMAIRWSESTIRRISGYLLGCCADFGLVADNGRSARTIQRFSIRPEVALYLAHDLHFAGVSDSAIIQHRDWLLFGFEPGEVLNCLKTLSHDGHFLVQSSGELVQISWKYRSTHDYLNALTQR
jgi:hypothetical protein